jgi:hypothetical protein
MEEMDLTQYADKLAGGYRCVWLHQQACISLYQAKKKKKLPFVSAKPLLVLY